MQKHTLIFLIITSSLMFACGSDGLIDEEMEIPSEMQEEPFPQKYIYRGIDLMPSEFFLVNENDFDQISPESNFLKQIDSVLLVDYLSEDGIYFPFREIILVSDSIARMRIINQESGEELNLEYPYEIIENKIKFFFSPDPLDFLVLTYDNENKQLFSCLQTHLFIHEKREFQTLELQDCTSEDQNEIIDELINGEIARKTLNERDTLMLNISALVLEYEE